MIDFERKKEKLTDQYLLKVLILPLSYSETFCDPLLPSEYSLI